MKRSFYTGICILLAGVVALAVTGPETNNCYELVVPDYDAMPEAKADEMTLAMLKTYGAATSELIRQLHKPNMPNMAKVKIIYLLGELRVLAATGVLIENIDLAAERMDPKDRIARWGPYPAREALVKIGPYASRIIMQIIGSPKFDEAKLDGYVAVLAEIELPRYALMKLQDRLCETTDEIVRGQYEAVVARLGTVKAEVQRPESKRLDPAKSLLSQDARIRDRAVDSMWQDRQAIIDDLIALVDPDNADKYTDQTRCAAAYLLGMFRSVKAVPVLSRALADEPGRMAASDISRYDAPVWTALVRIGRPSIPAMIENIETSDHDIVPKKSLDVLCHVLGGKRRVLELLARLKTQAEDRRQVQRIEFAIQHSQAHFKEDREPLY
jgi:hypothetical protein